MIDFVAEMNAISVVCYRLSSMMMMKITVDNRLEWLIEM